MEVAFLIRPWSSIWRRTARRAAVGILLYALLLSVAWADNVDIHINGIEDPLLSNVRGTLSVADEHEKPWSGEHIQRLFRLAPKEIRQALQPYGYFSPKVEKSLDPPEDDDKTWQAHFHIDHGPATEITRLNLAVHGPGQRNPAIRHALESTQLAEGERLVEPDYSDTKGALQSAARNAGYLDAQFTQSVIRVNPKTQSAEIDLVLDTGERYYFGPVSFDQSLLNDHFVHRYVPFERGQPFNADQLVNLQLALSDTDYYRRIEISAPREDAFRAGPADALFHLLYPAEGQAEPGGELQIPVTVRAKKSKPQHYTVSAGYGTDTGPRLGLGMKFRHLNQYGHQLSLHLRVSQIQRTLKASYDIPIEDVRSDKLSFTAKVSNREYGDITSNLYGVGVQRDTGWALGRKRPYLELQREFYNLGDGGRASTLLYPGYNISLQQADSLIFTHKGVSLSLDVRGGSAAVLSTTDFFRADFNAHVVLPVTDDIRVLMRTELGAIQVSDFRKLPPSQRFFAGGENSVRGYSYQSISPTNSHNDHIGGQYLATASFEVDYFFYKNFGIAGFFDAGDAANSTDFDFKRGAGMGFRWASPVGMVHLDVAYPFDSSDNYFIGFSLGPDL